MSPLIKQVHPTGKRDDWGFFVPIDLETNLNKTQTKKQHTSSLIIISEEEKLKYYLKLHQPQKNPTVVVIKNLYDTINPHSLKNSFLKINKETPDSIKNSSFHNTYLIITTILSSGLFLYFYSPSMFKLN